MNAFLCLQMEDVVLEPDLESIGLKLEKNPKTMVSLVSSGVCCGP